MQPPPTGPIYARQWEIRPSDHAAVTSARREFAVELRRTPSSNESYAASELIFGELVHNAVRHAASFVVAQLIVGDDVRLRVEDDGPCFVLPCPAPDPKAENGRGLAIVGAITRGLSVKHIDDGSCIVTARLPVDAPMVAHDA